ncbi:MAG: dihydroneopterin triphosphate diphosphatase [Zoogloeaceae bacterium]|jgi:dATP pyrophosphohydrolase|nr:dihydroneopterin triphosphate diphosphatase [Zoogloeaceae bacterium]
MPPVSSPLSRWKRPESVLVVVYRRVFAEEPEILLLERAAHPGYWQSVTGSLEAEETPLDAACREVREETGIRLPAARFHDWHVTREYEIFPEWRDRYAPGITRNVEHVFSLAVSRKARIRLSEPEHRDFLWLPAREAARRCFSPSNRKAILALARTEKSGGDPASMQTDLKDSRFFP